MGEIREPDSGSEPEVAEPGRSSSRISSLLGRHKYLAAFLGAVGTATVGVLIPQLIHGVESKATSEPTPLQVQVITDIARFRSDANHIPLYLIQRPATALGAPPNRYAKDPSDPHSQPPGFDPERYAWAHRMGGVDADETLLRLSISGTSAAATDLQQIRVRIVRCQAPLHGTEVTYLGLGDEIGARFFTVILDAPDPIVKYVGTGTSRSPGAQPFPLRVTNSIQEEFDIAADTLHSECQWKLLLDWTQGDRSGTMVISDGGTPFETTAGDTESGPSNGVKEVYWDPTLQKWLPTPT